jgi:hypothetical protein
MLAPNRGAVSIARPNSGHEAAYMESKKVANSAEVDARRAQVDASELRAELAKPWLGTALIEMYEAGAEHPIKTDLLDQFVSIIRRKDRRDERAREIANLIRGWQRVRRG